MSVETDNWQCVVYNASLWDSVAPLLSSSSTGATGVPEFAGAIIYSNADEESSLTSLSIPCLKHLAGNKKEIPGTETQPSFSTEPSANRVYEYVDAKSSKFALPFQSDFSYSLEALSHTRNLSFLKPLMNGPYFDLEQIWDEHTYFEFENRSVEWTMSTMVQEPYVNHIPTVCLFSRTISNINLDENKKGLIMC